ncbi:DsbA family protein [Pedobacter antarcticus]|uniref:DSBA oxidoreductase n=2 Tax=Pedobacter antarcticus TaxID=34086 RepID=A0A081PCT1_9SPHI|nr:thioredoxin domain-containing protein [Pedobacter antarcticus]KEQ28504.1 DSBA oxidoreductase [Pedobacter antarcticus 4BY]SDL82119.1 Thioredoxin [Pedobacter antarcticus]SFF02482.1 Thioredoxin [Pedobacter antarcticus]
MSTQLKPEISEQDHTRGNKKAQLEIVEYGDFQCPACGDAEPLLEEMLDQFNSVLSLTFRNFPLKDAHKFAYGAALAAEAAGKQGKYWEMHDLLFSNQDSLNETHLIGLAERIGLDTEVFERDLRSKDAVDKIEADFESGARSGVNGTPTFFVNGTRFDGGAADLYQIIKDNATMN